MNRTLVSGVGGLWVGRLHHKLFSHQDFFEVAVVPAGGEAFVLDTDAGRRFLLQQTERRATQDAEVCVGVPIANAGLVLGKCHIQLPVQTILDAPVTTHRRGKTPRRQKLAENVVLCQ